jgi:ribosomal protein S18 acetylase RimI-like enzyme
VPPPSTAALKTNMKEISSEVGWPGVSKARCTIKSVTGRGDKDGDRAVLRRCDRVLRALERLCVDSFEPVEGGFAAQTPSLPLVWDDNFVMFERPGLSAERMAEICDEAQGGAGLAHRTVMTTDPDEGERVDPGFRGMGWEVEGDVFMVLRSEPEDAPQIEVSEVPHPVELRRSILHEDEDFLKLEPEGRDALVEQLIESERRLDAADGDSWFVADADGTPATTTRLLTQNGYGFIDAVGTLRSARRRRLARATVHAAARASLERRNEVTFLIAAEDDWPRHFYERFGFAPVGKFRTFRKPPGPEDPAGDGRG